MNKQRQLIYFRNYYWTFFNKQPRKVKDKIDQVLYLIGVAEKIPRKFFDKIKGYDGLFEIRIEYIATFIGFSAALTRVIW